MSRFEQGRPAGRGIEPIQVVVRIGAVARDDEERAVGSPQRGGTRYGRRNRGSLLGHWQLVLGAAVAGFAFGVLVLVAVYLAPLLRLRSALNEEVHSCVSEGELGHPWRLGDASAAVLEEHGLTRSILRTL